MATVIESLLVSLGFRSDTSGASAFTGAMDGVIGKAAALAGVLGGLFSVSAVGEASKDIENFANLANETTDEIQKLSFAVASVGFSDEKIADVLKDVNDKVGDFLSTGGGELKDFFETIAPKVGVTADQFRNLSGSDALQLYYSTLEKANLSQAEMTFYLEAMANDATALAPLLKNNGAEFERLGSQAERLGLILDKETIEAGKEFNRTLETGKAVIRGFGLRIGAELLPTAQDLLDWLFSFSDNLTDAIELVGYAVDQIEKIAKSVRDWADEMGITEYAVTALQVAVAYLGTALMGLAVGGAVRTAIAAIMLLFNPMLMIGAVIGGLILIIDDFMAYGEGRPSVIGQLIKDYPVIGQIIDAVQSLGATFGMLFSENSEGFGELGTAFGGLFDALQPVFAAIISMIPTLINIVGFLFSLLVSGTGDSVGWLTTLVNIIGFLIDRFVAFGEGVGESVGWVVVKLNGLLDVIRSVGVWFDSLASKFNAGLPEINLPSMPSLPSLSSIGAKLGLGTVINNNQQTSVTVPTAAAAASIAQAANSSAKDQIRSARSGKVQ